jgi:integrase/recombinase XerD
MNKITVNRIVHRGKRRLALAFAYAPEINSAVRRLRSVAYSGTLRRWHVEDTEENLRQILEAFRGIADVDISGISFKSSPVAAEVTDASETSEGPDIQEVPELSINPEVPPGPVTISEVIDDKEDDVEAADIIPAKCSTGRYGPVEFRVSNNQLIIKFTGRYDSNWIDELKSYGRVRYDKNRKEFLMHWSKLTTDSLSDYFSSQGVAVRIIRPRVGAEMAETRKKFGDEVRSRDLSVEGREAVEQLKDYMERTRYSRRTSESYLALLELFFKFFNDRKPDDILQNDVAEFMNDFIIANGFSQSYQNQMVSAIKMYYEVTGTGKVIPQYLERPRRGRALPKVFSKEEVSLILNSSRNTKHKLILWMIYSCGLRRSEVTNIRMTDIDRNRNIIHIREGKGGVDRIVPVSEKVWQKIDEYICNYSPVDYLFEGQNGKRYSVESVYNLFKQALKKAGIKKEVGVHSLRHSYATHLHESGLDIRYIQELLGHKSTRTTEIYTHVSRRNLIAVKSPIEDLDVK